jgi:electron transport complex protein RnfG
MPDLMRGLIFLTVLGVVCGGLLHAASTYTRDEINANRESARRAVIAGLIGDTRATTIDLTLDLASHQAGDCISWILRQHTVTGYAGPITFLLLFEEDGLTVRTTAHRETPGIGDFIDIERSRYLIDHDGWRPNRWLEADTVSGATVTTAALKRAIREASSMREIACRNSVERT